MTTTTESVEIAFGVRDGMVVMSWREPTVRIAFEPQNAYEFGEAISRCAHRARYGAEPATDRSYLAEQVRARITEDLRGRLIARVAIMVPSMVNQNKSPGQIALAVVDAVLREVV